jgi:phosphatidate phosphatase APP1
VPRAGPRRTTDTEHPTLLFMSWRRTLNDLADALDAQVDRARDALVNARPVGPPRVVPYRDFGTPQALGVRGRVLRDLPLPAAGREDAAWRNLLATLRRFDSREVAGARVRVSHGGAVRVLTTDDEGYFETTLALAAPVTADLTWHEVHVELLPDSAADSGHEARAPVLVPSRHAVFGIVSDVDDTVVRTDATQFLRMMRTVFLGNARTRLPFPGVAAFYRALQRGPHGDEINPLFYVSSGPWNLYELLVEFFELQKIPRGPLLLRDWGIGSTRELPTHHVTHKGEAIRRILATYPTLPFILVGDSGQDDPEIYAAVIREFPGRIHVAYIRDVNPDEQRRGAIRALAEELAAEGGALVVAEDTLAAARHAAAAGWLDPQALGEVAGEAKR